MSGGWAQLPEAIMEAMLRQIVLADYIRFGAVSVSWRSITLKRTTSLRRQLPWLMANDCPEPDGVHFLSPSENLIYKLKLPKPAYCWGAYEGWLMIELLSECRKSFLFNPMTRKKVGIPPLSTLPFSVENPRSSIHMATLSSVPVVPRSLVIICLYNEGNLALCTPGDRQWHSGGDKGICYVAIMFHNRCLYALDNQLQLWCAMYTGKNNLQILMKVDISLPLGFEQPDFLSRVALYLAKNDDGKILLVTKIWKDEILDVRIQHVVKGFRVFELNERLSRWNVVDKFGDYMLVLGSGYAKSFSANNTSGAIADRIYLTEESYNLVDKGGVPHLNPCQDCVLCVYNCENCSLKPYFRGPAAGQRHFCNPSIWFSPDPRQRLEQSPISRI